MSGAEWSAFLDEVDWARRRLSSLPAEVPGSAPTCFSQSEDTQMGLFAKAISNMHKGPATDECAIFDNPGGWGYFREFSVPADGFGNQGYILGWHSKHRDDDLSETKIKTLPHVRNRLLLSLGVTSSTSDLMPNPTGSQVVMQLLLVHPAFVDSVKSRIAGDPAARINVQSEIVFVTEGDEVVGEFSYPVELCDGCLIEFPPDVPVTTTSDGRRVCPRTGDPPRPCIVGQDEPVDCRLLGDGG